jgi:hypothetical protein
MAISVLQLSKVAEQEVAKLLVVGSDGLLDVGHPQPDDAGFDLEVFERWAFGGRLLLQVRCVRRLHPHARSRRLMCGLKTKEATGNCSWYFIGHFDCALMKFTNPVFLMPAWTLQAMSRKNAAKLRQTRLHASMEPSSHDRFAPYRLNTHEVGKRVLYIVRSLRDPGEFLPAAA